MSSKKYVFNNLDDCPPEETVLGNRFINLSGKTFNSLTALYPCRINGVLKWVCKCNQCGKYVAVISKYLISGHTKTCGCAISKALRKDRTNEVIGNFIIRSFAFTATRDKNANNFISGLRDACWNVECKLCGTQFVCDGYRLSNHRLVCPLCGEMSYSAFESKKASIILSTLKNSKLKHLSNVQVEKTFDDCILKRKLKFDFYIPASDLDGFHNNEFLIEYDGPQHYKPNRWFGNKSESDGYKGYIYTQVYDWYKDLYCIEHDIPLIRIKYGSKNCSTFEELYQNSYIVSKSHGYDKKFKCFDIIAQDFVNNGLGSTFLIESGISCTFKCDKECKQSVCQNSPLTNASIIELSIDRVIEMYNSQNISHSITFQGLEPLDNLKQHLWFIYYFRKISNDPIILWTGYDESECEALIYLIKKMNWINIIIKYGRYIPNRNKIYDEILGVWLSSDNQYAKEID